MTDVKTARKTALIVVDAQESFKARGDAFWESGGPKDFEDNIKSLVTGFRKAIKEKNIQDLQELILAVSF